MFASTDILTERWPALAQAMARQRQQQATENFSRLAYRMVVSGIIRLDDRRILAKAADRARIRPFDAQLLIACAIRQWHLVHAGDPRQQSTSERLVRPQEGSSGEASVPRFFKTWTPRLFAAVALVGMEALIVWACLR